MLKDRSPDELTSHFRISLLRNRLLHYLKSLQLSLDRGGVWGGGLSPSVASTLVITLTWTFLVEFQQILQHRGRFLEEPKLSHGFAFSELGLDIIRILRENL